MFRALFALFVLILAFAASAAGAADKPDKRIALVIGNGAYASAPLKNPVNDARDMGAALRALGFEVIEKTNASQKEMLRAIAQFGERLGGDSVALFYYAGHGLQVKGKNFLIPVDAQITGESSVRAETVDVDAILDQLANSPLSILILDACRNNPFERRFRSAGGGLAQMDAPKGSLIAYATAPGKVAADGEGRNGLYTQELLAQLRTPGLAIEQMFKRVRANVARRTGDNQIPWEASSLTGDFYFVRGAAPAAAAGTVTAPAPLPPAGPDPVELAYWESIKASTLAADYAAYLEKYPDGQFAALARNRLAAREAEKQAAESEQRRLQLEKDSIEGSWHWFTGDIMVFKAGGTLESDGVAKGRWQQTDPARRKFRVSWDAGWIDDLYLSEDGRKLQGSNQFFIPVSATRVAK